MENELKACPFCGSLELPFRYWPGNDGYAIHCRDCNIGTGAIDAPELPFVIAQWNRRERWVGTVPFAEIPGFAATEKAGAFFAEYERRQVN